MTRRYRRIILAIAVLPLAVLIGLRSAWAAYACSVDGKVRAACCCPKKASAEQEPADDAPRASAACCCEVTLGESSAPHAWVKDPSRTDDVPWLAAPAAPLLAPVARIAAPIARIALARPPPLAVPIYLANRTLLR